MKLYRGTQKPKAEIGVRGAPSYTPILEVAMVWSAMPGDLWARRKPSFLKGSTVHIAELNTDKILDLRGLGTYASLGDVLRKLDYDRHPDFHETLKIYNYLHNRIIGRAKGGEFRYKVFDGEEELDESDVPFDLRNPQTLISWEIRDDFYFEPTTEVSDRLVADTYIFADAPALQKAAKAIGYECIVYTDIFQGGETATQELLGIDWEDIPEMAVEYDIDDEEVPAHDTYRPLTKDAIIILESKPTSSVLASMRAK